MNLTHYVILEKDKNFLKAYFTKNLACSSSDPIEIVDFMWGKNFNDYVFIKNGRKIDFSKHDKNEYVNLNNFKNFLINY